MVKVISLSERAYEILKRNKKPDMSFSDIIITHMNHEHNEKKEGTEDLIMWIKQHEIGSIKKEKINHDAIAYGVKR